MAHTEPDEPLVDTTLADEIELLADVMATVTSIGRRLSQAEVDEALGLSVPKSCGNEPPGQE